MITLFFILLNILSERYTPPEASKKDMTYIYTGISIAGVVVVVMVVIGVFFVKKRRDNPAQDRYTLL